MNIDSVIPTCRRLTGDRRGNFTMIFGLGVAVIFLAAGVAVDYSTALMNKTRVNNALDAATLATARAIASGDVDPGVADEAEDYLEAVFIANLGVDDLDASNYSLDSITINTTDQSVAATASIAQQFKLLQVGSSEDTITVSSSSAVSYGVSDIEVAMVLDVTGSMRGTKLSALEDAAELAVKDLLSINTDAKDYVRISLVPYAIGVNVGPDLQQYVYADAYCETSDAPTYSASLHSNTGVAYDWATFQANNASCDGGSAFLDEDQGIRFAGGFRFGGGAGIGSSYGFDGYTFGDAHVYLAKKGGGSGDDDDSDDSWDFVTESDGTNSDYCASDRKAPASGGTSYQYTDANPSYGMISRDARLEEDYCPDSEIITLTSNETTLTDAISAFTANGYTAGHIGLQWGWYTISHDWASFMPTGSEPGDHKDPDAEIAKYIIMMTDGVFNTAYADVESDGFKTGKQSTRSYTHFDALCTAIKNDDITIFSIGFQLSNSTAQDALDNCATDDTANVTYYYDVDSASELEDTFREIAATIQSLRLTH
ncbi:pilus assembly protein [Hoeflea poritis]|uniref:Pilus assembly protein n=1 Tax=Hoeflea poritis TaxID=2993659 RepID=A0ABT4VMQ9_9HYPH|nr:pilus assembly protein [Hoeflea poritis]MDA4845407.1 pilus assembly protein [Hoeflea poritis]